MPDTPKHQPSLAEYLEYLRDVGCVWRKGYTLHHGVSYNLVKIWAPHGQDFVKIYKDINAPLSPHEIESMNRVLGV